MHRVLCSVKQPTQEALKARVKAPHVSLTLQIFLGFFYSFPEVRCAWTRQETAPGRHSPRRGVCSQRWRPSFLCRERLLRINLPYRHAPSEITAMAGGFCSFILGKLLVTDGARHGARCPPPLSLC